MKAPAWLVIESFNPASGRMTVRVRRWHPGFWWCCLRALTLVITIRIGKRP